MSFILRAPAVGVGLALAIFMPAAPAWAGIIQTTGAAKVQSAPPSVLLGDLQSNKKIRVFVEQIGIVLDQNLTVDVTIPGTYASKPTPLGQIDAGTIVNSYLLHQDNNFDPSTRALRLKGSVKFDEDIIGVIINKKRLVLSDALLGHEGTQYISDFTVARGLELNPGKDKFTISANRRRLTFSFISFDVLDEIRVITAGSPIPTPGSAALLMAASLMLARRRKRRAQAAA